ncbi:hypothetical protein ACTXJG_17905 [Glutamicibacter arilaitensis]|uniref:hypothetical protein n=1 Tax=Glutamicibacter arilaitensis TaxID=256701 RepID=UPI003FD493B7
MKKIIRHIMVYLMAAGVALGMSVPAVAAQNVATPSATVKSTCGFVAGTTAFYYYHCGTWG